MDQPPWFERAGRQCRVAWADPETELELWEEDQLRKTASCSCEPDTTETVSRVGFRLGNLPDDWRFGG